MNLNSLLVQTAAGTQPLAAGIIYAHEHLWLNLSTERDPAGKLDQYALIVEELRELKQLGVAAIIEQTCYGMGRDVTRLRQMQLETGVQIIPASGYYHQRFHPPAVRGACIERIVELLTRELTEGMDGTAVTPMLLGEIGGSDPPLHPDEINVFKAVARLAQTFPIVITTHAHLGGGGRDELHLLLQGGVTPGRILIGHQDLCPNLEDVLYIAQQGAYVGFDTIGKNTYAPDTRRIAYIKALVKAGLAGQILFSCDISRNSYLRKNGGQGYSYLLRVFLPMLIEAGIPEAVIRHITEENPRRFLFHLNPSGGPRTGPSPAAIRE